MNKMNSVAISRSYSNYPLKVLFIGVAWLLLSSCLGWSENTLNDPQNPLQAQKPAIADSNQTAEIGSKQEVSNTELTQDFLGNTSPLSAPTPAAKPVQADSSISVVAVSGTGRECSNTGNAENGSESCLSKAKDGSFSETSATWENFGDESKKQTVVKRYDSNGKSAGEDTTRIKTIYQTDADGKRYKKHELYDIVNIPAQGLITRDLIVKNYDKSDQLTKTTWAHYREIGIKKAGLETHAVLYYKDGQLASGYADRYKNGKVIDTPLNFNPAANPNLRMELTGVSKWAQWINQLIHQSSAAI